jgi:hypothetical protein
MQCEHGPYSKMLRSDATLSAMMAFVTCPSQAFMHVLRYYSHDANVHAIVVPSSLAYYERCLRRTDLFGCAQATTFCVDTDMLFQGQSGFSA